MVLRRVALGAAVLVGCGAPASEPPTPAPLEPVDRSGALVWTADAGAGAALAQAAGFATPTAVLVDGDADPEALNAALDALDAALPTEPRIDRAVVWPALPPDAPGAVCFDRRDPRADPASDAHIDALQALLRDRPDASDVVLRFDAAPAPWAVDCACPACESDRPEDVALRLTTVHAGLAEAAALEFRTLWWWDAAPYAVEAAMQHALQVENTDRHLPLRVASYQDAPQPWARPNPRLAGTARRVAADLDVSLDRHGTTDAFLFPGHELAEAMGKHRSEGDVGWFAAVDGPSRSVVGDLASEAALRWVAARYRDPDATAVQALGAHLGVDPDGAAGELLESLAGTGLALDLVSFPLGIAAGPFGADFPAFEAPGASRPAFAERYDALQAPDLATVAAVYQWGAEATVLVGDARADLAFHDDALAPADAARIDAGLEILELEVAARVHALNAAVTLAWGDPEGSAWVRADAAALTALAPRISALAGRSTVSPEAVQALADAASLAAGPGTAGPRPFPRMARLDATVDIDRQTVFWEVAPASTGRVEWGTQWPVYDDGGSGGDEPAVRWSAWREEPLPADTRLTWRACTEADVLGDVLTICSSDRVLRTPR